MVRIIMNGCNGHMGQVISDLVSKDENAEIVAGVDLQDTGRYSYPVFTELGACDVKADVMIDFSSAKATDAVLEYCGSRELPLVLCTTGLSQEQLQKVEETAEKTAVLRSANMSLGINTLLKLLQDAAKVLAAAGLKRLGMDSCIGRYFSCEEMIPAAGQGILAVQARAGEYQELLEVLNDPRSEAAAKAERAFVKVLNGGCTSPVAAYAEIRGSKCHITGLYWRESDENWFVEKTSGNKKEAELLGETLAHNMQKKYGK